jgi:UDP-N-acetylglucosamine/UDP-N-acetylgalactosamine 4-epimerase
MSEDEEIWLVTGAAGFVGSHIAQTLLREGKRVRAIDNFATGFKHNLNSLIEEVGPHLSENFEFVKCDVRDRHACNEVMKGVRRVLHQAGLGSVPRSLVDPITTNEVNVSGFLNVLDAARQHHVESFVYAASSSTYGSEPSLPKIENRIGVPLSPYAVTKFINELYAANYKHCFDFRATGLRYFNVFGPRQDPNGAYAAVIPKWIAAMIAGEEVRINGDGQTSRDFCFVKNAVQANLKAATAPTESRGEVYNVAVGGRTSLNQLFTMLKAGLLKRGIEYNKQPVYVDLRKSDVRHSQADISKARNLLGYDPGYNVEQGLEETLDWYISKYAKAMN